MVLYRADEQRREIIIVGGGLSGTLAAILLGRRNIRVTLIDLHHPFPPVFRAEQLVGEQVETLARLDLLSVLAGQDVPVGRAIAMRAGRTVGTVAAPHYGIRYEEMVNRARAHLPSTAEFITEKVVGIQTSAGRQTVALSDGRTLDARLVILSAGLGQRLQKQLGIGVKTVRKAHSLTFGFDIETINPVPLSAAVLVAYGERGEDLIDYITVFPIENRLRANLFTYGRPDDILTRALMKQPGETLLAAMPSLRCSMPGLKVTDCVKFHVNDLKVATGTEREGVVLVGDAFQTPCPAAGTGIGRLLVDLERLCHHHIPAWLATGGMDAAKIAGFYDDRFKRSSDAEALRVAEYRRALTVETSLPWRIHRRRVTLQNWLRRHAGGTLRAGMGMAAALPSLAGVRPTASASK